MSHRRFGLVAFAALAYASPAAAQQACISGTPPEGVDLNVSTQPSWTTAKSTIAFGIIKATQGDTYVSAGFATSWAALKTAGLIRGAYHFFDPTVSGVTQANHFLSVVTLEAGDLPPTLDIECPTSNTQPNSANCLGNGTSGDATGAQITQGMNDWINTIVAATGRKPIIYTYGSYFVDDGVDTTGLQNYPLWLADYSGTNCYTVPSPWAAATIWQYGDTGTVAGISGAVDHDYFLGTLAELTAFAGGTFTVDAGAPPDASGDIVPDAGGTLCARPAGAPGECLDVTVCDTLGGTYSPTAGYCPGAANIQCCTGMPAKPDAGTKPDSSTSSGSGSGTGSLPGSGSGTGLGSGTGTGVNALDAGLGGGDAGFDPNLVSNAGGCSISRSPAGSGTGDAPLRSLAALAAVGLALARRRRATPA